MTDDERARALMYAMHINEETGNSLTRSEVEWVADQLLAYARVERRRAFEDCATIAEKRQGIHGEYIATAIRRQAEEEAHG